MKRPTKYGNAGLSLTAAKAAIRAGTYRELNAKAAKSNRLLASKGASKPVSAAVRKNAHRKTSRVSELDRDEPLATDLSKYDWDESDMIDADEFEDDEMKTTKKVAARAAWKKAMKRGSNSRTFTKGEIPEANLHARPTAPKMTADQIKAAWRRAMRG